MNSEDLAIEFGMMSVGEVLLLKKYIKMIDPGKNHFPIVINIGSGAGTSVVSILEAVPEATVFTVDLKSHDLAKKNIQKCGMGEKRILYILGDSKQVGRRWPSIYKYNFVFVDGNHSDEGVLGDLEAWVKRLPPGSFVAFHDYDHPNVPSLKTVVDQRMKELGWEFIEKERFLGIFVNTNEDKTRYGGGSL